MASPTLRKCTIADWESLLTISKITFQTAFGDQNKPSDMELYMHEAFSEEKIKAELSHPNSIFYFVLIGEVVVGYFKLNWGTAQSESISNGFEIERIYVLAAYQGLSIGQLMMNKIFEMARAKNYSTLWLGVWNQNEGAIRFYQRNGFKTFAKHDFLLGTDLQTDLLMKLSLN